MKTLFKIPVLLLALMLVVSCGNEDKSENQELINKIKQKVKTDALGVEMNYQSISFRWIDTLTVEKELINRTAEYNEMLKPLIQFDVDKKTFLYLRNWENNNRDTPFYYGEEKYKNYEEFAFANRNISSFIFDLCNQIEESDKILNDWDNLEKGNLQKIRNAIWYYDRIAIFNGKETDLDSILALINELEELKDKNDRLLKMDADEVLEYKALNVYKINNPMLNGVEQEISKHFIFDKELNVIRAESIE